MQHMLLVAVLESLINNTSSNKEMTMTSPITPIKKPLNAAPHVTTQVVTTVTEALAIIKRKNQQ